MYNKRLIFHDISPWITENLQKFPKEPHPKVNMSEHLVQNTASSDPWIHTYSYFVKPVHTSSSFLSISPLNSLFFSANISSSLLRSSLHYNKELSRTTQQSRTMAVLTGPGNS
jgi:hypothetical protein